MLPLAHILQPIIDVFEAGLSFFHDDLGVTWGLAIIFLTILVRLVILPLSLKQIKGMRQLQLHAPELKMIQERYKDDPERKQREMMRFYQENEFNPLASCLPLLLQLPVFIGMFELLRSEEFKADVLASGSEGFLFIDSIVDQPAGLETAILIVLVVASSLAIFLFQPSPGTTSNLQRYGIAAVFTIILGVFVPFYPAGLSIYWTATGLWALGQQLVVLRVMPPPAPPTEEELEDMKKRIAPPPPPRKKKRKKR